MKKDSSLNRYDLFIFDWDGTLCEMHSLLRLNEWIKRRLHTWNRTAKIKEIEANRKNLKSAIEIEQTKNEFLAIIFEAAAVFYKPRLHRNAVDLITLLRKKGKRVAILSNGNGGRLSKELGRMGIRDKFNLVVSAKDIGAIKPDPRGLNVVISRLRAKKSRTLYIGDMIDDVLTADLAGIDSCAVSNGFDSHEKLRSAGPTYLLRGLAEFYTKIQ
ncbi:MAG: HAD family hydrolase [Candidatus Micrarchaeota archaeon]|nr:HAD family hydrolase [Candidatus Micrarchaeota archaeon]